jgi:dipeptidase E
MRLYLSSFDLGNCPEKLVALAGAGRRTAIIVNALDNKPDNRARWLKDQTAKLAALGFRVVELDLRSYFGASRNLETFLSSIDLVWINGGNAFVLRRAMKQSGFDLIIRASVARDEIVYAGFSAAAAIAFDSLKGLELTDDPNQVPSGYDPDIVWEGLGFIPFALAVHYKSDHPESESVDREIAFYAASGIPYRTLRDGEVLVINDRREEVAGFPNDSERPGLSGTRMTALIRKAEIDDQPTLRRQLEDYLKELSEFGSVEQAYPYFDDYWRDDPTRWPYLIEVGDHPVGFIFVNRWSPSGRGTDYSIAEFFIAPERRRHGYGTCAARQVFRNHPGQWELSFSNANVNAKAFWSTVIDEVSTGSCELLDHSEITILRFAVGAT